MNTRSASIKRDFRAVTLVPLGIAFAALGVSHLALPPTALRLSSIELPAQLYHENNLTRMPEQASPRMLPLSLSLRLIYLNFISLNEKLNAVQAYDSSLHDELRKPRELSKTMNYLLIIQCCFRQFEVPWEFLKYFAFCITSPFLLSLVLSFSFSSLSTYSSVRLQLLPFIRSTAPRLYQSVK